MPTDICDPVVTEYSYWPPEAPEMVKIICNCGNEEYIPPEWEINCKVCGHAICQGCKDSYEGKCKGCDEDD